MVQALSRKDQELESLNQELESLNQELESLNQELSDYVENFNNLQKLSCINGKPINCLNNLQQSYLVKQNRSELSKLCHIEKVLRQFPGEQISFSETLKTHITDFLKSHSGHNVAEDPIKIKISAKMSKTPNSMILSYALLQTGKNIMSSRGNRTVAL